MFWYTIQSICILTNDFYAYILSSQPMIILVFYLCAYTLCGTYLIPLNKILQTVQTLDTGPTPKTSIRYMKGKYKYQLQGVRAPLYIKHKHKQILTRQMRERTLCSNIDWSSTHDWEPLLEEDYSTLFDSNCNTYDHYLEAALHRGEFSSMMEDNIPQTCDHCYTALDDDLFLPRGRYVGKDGVPIIFDTGCSISVTPHKQDFVGTIRPMNKLMTGLSSKAEIKGAGKVKWEFRDDFGVSQVILVEAYYIPTSSARLLSPQSYFQQEKRKGNIHGSFKVTAEGCIFTFSSGKTLTFICDDKSSLPIVKTQPATHGFQAITPLPNNHLNVSKAQEELLLWHNVFGHYNIHNTQKLMQTTGVDLCPIITPKHPGAATCTVPLCKSCLHGKGGRTSLQSVRTTTNPEYRDVIKKGDLLPGDCISTDQYVCRVKGRLPHTMGKEDPSRMYSGGTVFVDHASSMISIYNQVSLGASDTIRSKNSYEAKLAESNVTVKSYRADNGVYTSDMFTSSLEIRHQKLSLSGVGSHGQNGVAERAIQSTVNSARTMMLHQALMWPAQFDMRLWPFAMNHAAYLWNHLPNGRGGIAPIEILTQSKLGSSPLKNEHTWGCPAYVLDPKLQDGKKLPKWDPKTRQGQYLGKSPSHASSVGLIRNLTTGFISPQFHVVYDSAFQTVMGGYDHNDAVSNHIWDSLVENDTDHTLNQSHQEK